LHRAAYNGRRAACETLVRAGASLTTTTKDGNTALHLATFMNQLSTMETLLGMSARVDSVNLKGKTPLDLCITDAAREIISINTPKVLTPAPKPGATDVIAHVEVSALVANVERLTLEARERTLASKQKPAFDDFPDLDGPHVYEDEGHPLDDSLVMRAAGTNQFLSTAAAVYDAPSPYGFMDPAAPDARDQRNSSSGSTALTERTSISTGRVHDRASSSGTAAFRGSVGAATNAVPLPGRRSTVATQDRSSLGAGQLPPRSSLGAGTPASTSGSMAGWGGSDRLSASEFQARVKEDNRKVATGPGHVLLSPGGASSAGPRPASSNKKFLQNYGLEKQNLFGP